MMLEIDIEADEEWDSSSTDWSLLVRRAAEAAIAESAFPQLAEAERPVELSVRLGYLSSQCDTVVQLNRVGQLLVALRRSVK